MARKWLESEFEGRKFYVQRDALQLASANGLPFHWDFTEPTDDHQQAVHNATRTFLSGLTIEEKRAARDSLDVVAHPTYLPPAPLPIR